ncbi:hypothetical protein [Acetobacter sp. DsW_063]|uniref:hypothetical protein n=1 Tax=Acetobacter sp. DsW_063 TaxID=1514894 RepID=UPI0011776743|nr:hypothetical protein [Acetobacter sp. DsW_063]
MALQSGAVVNVIPGVKAASRAPTFRGPALMVPHAELPPIVLTILSLPLSIGPFSQLGAQLNDTLS